MQIQGTFWKSYVGPGLKGAIAGSIATAPMTVTMLAMHRYLVNWPRPSVPPKKIALGLAHRVGLKKHMDRPQQKTFAWVSHVAYGASMGSVYGSLVRRIPLPSSVKGIGFGLIVWAVSYLGWLPALELPGSAPDESWRRNAMMIAAHVVWGGTLGLIDKLLGE